MEDLTQGHIYIKYEGLARDDDGSVDLSSLGTSLVGFDKLIRELIRISRVRSEVSIRVASFQQGSVIVDILIDIEKYLNQLPFDSPSDLLEFLKVADEELWRQAVHFFQDITNTSKTVYDYLSTHPVQLNLLTGFIFYLIGKAGKCKTIKYLEQSDLPKRIAEELHKLIQKKHLFKLPLKPIVEEKATSIEVSTDRQFRRRATINNNNFDEYLGENEKVLEHLNNGEVHTLDGEITSLKSTRGDSLTFKYVYKKSYNLNLLPPDDKTTKAYIGFYKEEVRVEAEVIRTSMYKKPILKIESIDFKQEKLFSNSKEDNAKTTTE